MTYFKKKLIKILILKIYTFINSLLVVINSFFKNINKNQIKVFYGGSFTGNMGGTLVKIKRLKKNFQNNYFGYNCVYLLSNSIYLNKHAIRNLKRKKPNVILPLSDIKSLDEVQFWSHSEQKSYKHWNLP